MRKSRWYYVTAKIEGWAIWIGFLVFASTAKEANDKARSYIESNPLDNNPKWARVIDRGCRVANEKTVERVSRDSPKSVIA